jgi:type I restriction enzyme, S subunit
MENGEWKMSDDKRSQFPTLNSPLIPPGYKLTEVGVIPEDWDIVPIGKAGQVLGGRQRSPHYVGELCKYLRVANVFDGFIDTEDVLEMPFSSAEKERFLLKDGDILLNEGQSIELVGRSAIYRGTPEDCCFQNTLVRFRAGPRVCPAFAQRVFQQYLRTGVFASIALQTTSIAHLGAGRLAALKMPLPTKVEQEAIAEALSDADILIESLEQLIAKKRQINQGAMQELLTGKRRLPEFSGEWKVRKIAEIASPSSEKNTAAEDLPVLTCSKHLGFVDSLGYFKNQVFSKDTSTYKLIRRGQIGYPANHIEEGSIGLQTLYDVALVSPIYVVFSVNERVDGYFLHRLLKLDSYRQKFKTATTSSVDRRGSLRWPAFSEITVSIPPLREQTAIATILTDMDAEIAALEEKLAKTRQLKQGMMQELLTGRIRLV